MAPTPCNYLLKTLEDKRKDKGKTTGEQERTGGQLKDRRVCQGTGEHITPAVGSAVPPMNLALPQCLGPVEGAVGPVSQRECAELLREAGALPWMSAGHG